MNTLNNENEQQMKLNAIYKKKTAMSILNINGTFNIFPSY